MKKYIINCFLLATVFIVGCKKEDRRYPFEVALARVPYASVIIDAASSTSIDLTNLASFSGKFNITLLYPTDIPPAKVDVVIIKNGVNSSVKIIQAGITTFPSTTITITAAQIATLFGAPIVLGDNYDIGIDLYTQDGTKYEAFPNAGGTNLLAYSGTGQANQPGFVPSIRFGAICKYDPDVYVGNFKAVDAFGDADGAIIVLTKISATQFSFIYPSALNPIPIVVTVNAANNVATTAQQLIGTAWSPAFGYPAGDPVYASPGVAASTGSVAPCAKSVTLNMLWRTGNFAYQFRTAPYPLTLTKQ